jgi:hypothetical protein
VVVPPVDHECALKDLVEDLANRLAKLEHENAQLKKAVLGSAARSRRCRASRPAPRRRPRIGRRRGESERRPKPKPQL